MTEIDHYESVRQKMRLGPLGTPKHKKVLEILKVLWNQEEIELLDHFDGAFQFLSAVKMAKKSGIEKAKVKEILKRLAKRGTILRIGNTYCLLTMAPGIFEHYILTRGDTKENLQRMYEFFRWAMLEILPPMFNAIEPSITIPKLPIDAEEKMIIVDESIPIVDQKILPGELVLEMIDKNDYFAKLECQCRLIGKETGDPCKIPDELGCFLCGLFAKMLVNSGHAEEIPSKEAAIQYVKDCEKVGLVHMGIPSGGPETLTFICNCCSCHCVMLSGIAKIGGGKYGRSNFEPRMVPELCIKCDTCMKKCPMGAIIHKYPLGSDPAEEKMVILTHKCIGCGVCAANCPKEAIKLLKVRTEGPPPSFQLGGKTLQEVLKL